MASSFDPDLFSVRGRIAAQTCIGGNSRLADLVGPALFLCSRSSHHVTGQILYVDGGFTAK